MIDEIKILLGEIASNYSDELIGLILKHTIAEVQAYCNRDSLDYELELIVVRLAVIKLNRIHSEGLSAQTYSGVSETFIDGYPSDVKAILNRKRRIKVI